MGLLGLRTSSATWMLSVLPTSITPVNTLDTLMSLRCKDWAGMNPWFPRMNRHVLSTDVTGTEVRWQRKIGLKTIYPTLKFG